jgi:hypothetical protein
MGERAQIGKMHVGLCTRGCSASSDLSVAITYAEISAAVGSVGTLVVLHVTSAADSGGKVIEIRVVSDLEALATSSDGWCFDASKTPGELLKVSTSGSCTCVSCTRSGFCAGIVASSRCSFSFVSTDRNSHIWGAVTILVSTCGSSNTIDSL